ncbi:hypothetical protein ACQ7HM_13425 [Williamsia sp. MIQD14]|uniref:hypothetical protein n=1 Tax=Williamsia sp. MIQD14 TaxID=3425703 RepID=UPI003DA094F3
MSRTRRERIIDEKRRLRVVRCWYALHLVAIVAVIAGLLIRNGPPDSWGFAIGMAAWLGSFAISSVLLLTGGLLGVYETQIPVTTIKVIASVVSLGSGFLLYGLSLVTTPVLLIAGMILRLAVIAVQRLLGLRLASATEIDSRDGDHRRGSRLLSREREHAPGTPKAGHRER